MSFHSELANYLKNNDSVNANRLLMQQLGKALIKSKLEFVQLLQGSDIEASIHDNDEELVNKFVDGIGNNRKLLIGSALLVNMNNKQVGFDGEEKISDTGVKQAYKTMHLYFDEGKYDVGEDASDRFYSVSGEDGNEEGGGKRNIPTGTASAIAQGVGELAKLGSQLSANRRNKKYGVRDSLLKKADAKNQIQQGALIQKQEDAIARQKEAEAKSKTTKTLLIVGCSLLGVILIGVAIYMIKKGKK